MNESLRDLWPLELIIFRSRFNQPQKSVVFETPLSNNTPLFCQCEEEGLEEDHRRDTYFSGWRVMWRPRRPSGSGGLLTRLDGHAHFFLLQFCFFRYWIFIFKLLFSLCIFFFDELNKMFVVSILRKKFSDKDGDPGWDNVRAGIEISVGMKTPH